MITTDDLNVIEGYVARDGVYEDLHFFSTMPYRSLPHIWRQKDAKYGTHLPDEMFPNLKWKDEPVKVELTIKKI